ncbi:MAG: hypothetical protein AAF581_22380 [Planctomycetota bacterium]
MKLHPLRASVALICAIGLGLPWTQGCRGVVRDSYFGLVGCGSLHYQRTKEQSWPGEQLETLLDFRWYPPSMGAPDSSFRVRAHNADGVPYYCVYNADGTQCVRYRINGQHLDGRTLAQYPLPWSAGEAATVISAAHAEVLRRSLEPEFDWRRLRDGAPDRNVFGQIIAP